MLPRKGESEEERRELRWWGGERRGEGRKRKELEGMIKWKIQSKRFIIPKGSDKNVTLGRLQIGNFGGD